MVEEQKVKTSIIDEAELNWTVRTAPIQTFDGIEIKGFNAIIRNDNNVPLSINSDTYQPYQNTDLFELLERVSDETDMVLHSGGFFGEGQRVFVQLKSNDLTLGDDLIKGYLTGVNSFDGSTSLAFGPSNVTISCLNTFFAAFRELNTKIRHTKNMKIRVDEALEALEKTTEEEGKIFTQIKRMYETPFDDVLQERVTKILFNVEPKINLKNRDLISTRTQNNIRHFDDILKLETNQKGDNLWGLFSGVTRYTTHELNGDMMKNKLFGSYGTRERAIFRELGTLVK